MQFLSEAPPGKLGTRACDLSLRTPKLGVRVGMRVYQGSGSFQTFGSPIESSVAGRYLWPSSGEGKWGVSLSRGMSRKGSVWGA